MQESIVFSCRGKRLAVPLEWVLRVKDARPTPPPPLAKEWVIGLVSSREGVFPVLRVFEGQRPRGTIRCLLVRPSKDVPMFALEVEGIGAISNCEFSADTFSEVGVLPPGTLRLGVTETGEEVLGVEVTALRQVLASHAA